MYAPKDSGVHVHFLDSIYKYFMVWGIPGLFAISFIDGAAFPIVGGTDALIILLSLKQPSMTFVVVLAATVGSTLGSLVLNSIGRKGGEKALSHISPERKARIVRRMQEYGIWAIIVTHIAPPPFPAKFVVLAAGVMHMGKIRFTTGAFIGRLIRYSLMGCLAVLFGDKATQVFKQHYPLFSLILISGIILYILIRILKKRSVVDSG